MGYVDFNCTKCILIVRNPLDCMTSLFNMIATSSHSQSIDEKHLEREDIKELWDEFI
jgi:hypothetical protein